MRTKISQNCELIVSLLPLIEKVKLLCEMIAIQRH